MSKLNILIVDDREENIIALEALIKRDDINILKTTSPNDALKIAWENEVAIALIDVQMPGMDGFELVEMLKSNPRTKDILVLFVTAISKESKYAVKGFSSGAVDYLYKPLEPIITVAKVDSFIQLAKAQAEIKLKNIELKKFSVIIDNSVDIICLVNVKTLQIEQINRAVERILGYQKEELLNTSIFHLINVAAQNSFKSKLDDLSNFGNLTFEFNLSHKDGHDIPTECRVTQNNNHYFFNISDYTLQKKYKEDLIVSREEAIHAKNVKQRFLANMSHELRTPLNGIIGISSLLNQTNLNPNQARMVNLLEISSQSLLGVVNDILDITKIDSGKLVFVRKEINIRHLLRSVIELLRIKANEKLLDLILIIDERIPKYIEADPLRINQILMNLIGNALKFTHKGYVKFSVDLESIVDERAKMKFTIEDTGIGIAKDRLNSIFESYEQAEDDTSIKYGGTGLGLGIVKKLVELHNEKINIKSEVGKGTTFWFSLNFKVLDDMSSNQKVNENEDKEELALFNNVKVLVAEDNLVNQFMIKKMLENWNIEVDAVEDGTQVLEKLKINNYDLILMDTHMPELGGYDTTKIIRTELTDDKRSIQIVSMSAAVLQEEKKAALDAGMNYVITKPFLPEDLHRLISLIVNAKDRVEEILV